jgi:hypothetical protein
LNELMILAVRKQPLLLLTGRNRVVPMPEKITQTETTRTG